MVEKSAISLTLLAIYNMWVISLTYIMCTCLTAYFGLHLLILHAKVLSKDVNVLIYILGWPVCTFFLFMLTTSKKNRIKPIQHFKKPKMETWWSEGLGEQKPGFHAVGPAPSPVFDFYFSFSFLPLFLNIKAIKMKTSIHKDSFFLKFILKLKINI